MEVNTILDKKHGIIAKYGPWTAHNIQLSDGLYTIAPKVVGDEIKLRRIVQCVCDLVGGNTEGLRVLDLGCLEGLYAIEFARRKATCLGIEAREANIEKARFTKQALSLENLQFVQDDVRNLSAEKYGHFDIVLCLGLLYHLDAPDVFSFVQRLGEVCRRICIVDTRITLHPKMSYSYDGHTYLGTRGEEHGATDSQETKTSRLWASLNNNENFWLSRATLYNLLSHVGFTSVYECNVPAEPAKPADRITVVGIKGVPERLISAPLIGAHHITGVPERPLRENSITVEALRHVGRLLPRNLRKAVKTVIARENKLS